MPQTKDQVRNRRKLKNLFLDPKNQISAALPPFLLGFLVMSFLFGFVIHGINETITSFAELAPPSDETLEAAEQARLLLWGTYFALMIAFLFSSVFLGALITHKYIGPIVPIQRQIKRMIDGDFSAAVQLRKGDQFQELADDVNKLADKLRSASAKNS